ncbi:MAG: biotin/lipoyl-binding protein, partial [Acidobacteria bacterium]|nr:biotin/lipoyl-binding protein [Acidobacteriota bacterium]
MQSKRQIVYLAGVLGVVSLAVAFGIWWSRRGVETVQTIRVARQDVTSLVTASGEIKPKNYVHISANAFGKIVSISVQEGARVREGQELARLEAIQSEAAVRAQQA